ncbi:hypothetical protein PIROE2DRAFT_5964 [Piromyces sp. E2]|nr:hypothetical protein PIROE2DRAFT_5964 [Piromyces sp. E2]|eukprot:OUM66752.1 hypothetical protein PIROE2DRAFT_5964 [Piromyces sp. E2]
MPIILNSYTSKIYIENTEIRDIISIFCDESVYSFSNVTFKDINTNSGEMISIVYNPVTFDKCHFNNIMCNGASDSSTLIEFISSDNGNSIDISNTIIENCKSNENLIKISGVNPKVNLSNININNIITYGPVINDMSSNSVINISDSNVNNNEKINKFKCGLIVNNKNTEINVNNSSFKNNKSKNSGDINSLNLNIYSSVFEYNHAVNGGVLYFKKSITNKNNNLIKLQNSIFSYNNVDYFGGVIYSNLENLNIVDIKNTTFKENYAYSGGGFYINNENNVNYKLFQANNSNIIYIDNKSESHGNDYATDPFKILSLNNNIEKINIKSGESYSLKFNVIDEYGQIVKDISKYYSDIILKISEDENENLENKKLTGNVCYFSRGICELKDFKIYTTVPSSLKLKFSVEIDNNFIKIDNNNIIVDIDDCSDHQIKMYDKNKFYSCENPLCSNDCPIANKTAECVKGEGNYYNKMLLNKCQCVSGWTGDKLIIFSEMIYFLLHRNSGIIRDPGLMKCELALLGLLFYFISNAFNIFSNYSNCFLNVFFKHTGILLLYSIFLCFIGTGCELGLNINAIQSSYIPQISGYAFQDSRGTELTHKTGLILENENGDNYLNEKSSKNEFGINNSTFSKSAMSKNSMYDNKEDNKTYLKKISKSIINVHSLITEIAIVYSLVVISLIMLIIFFGIKKPKKKTELDDELIEIENDRYEQEIKLIWNYSYVFKCTKYISYCTLIWIAIGPLFNIASFVAIYKQRNSMIYYFNSTQYEQCFVHKSFTCNCKKKTIEGEEETVKNYINIYKYCNKIFVFSDGHLRYINKQKKNLMKFII